MPPATLLAKLLHSSAFRNNQIWAGRAAGIAVTESGRGHISYNVITGMEWAGIDIRHGGNPVISHNCIQNGQADGIVVGEGGKSVIFDNSIEGMLFLFCFITHLLILS